MVRSWHVWALWDGGTKLTMRHVDAESEMAVIADLDYPYPERMEPCDGQGFYCISRGDVAACKTCGAGTPVGLLTSRGECVVCWQKDGQMDADLDEAGNIGRATRARHKADNAG